MIDKLSDDEYLLFFTNLFGLNYDYWPHQMYNTVPAQILRQSWLERHVSILFSKICQFLTFYLVKSSPKNPRWKLERRRSICAGTVVRHTTYDLKAVFTVWYSYDLLNFLQRVF